MLGKKGPVVVPRCWLRGPCGTFGSLRLDPVQGKRFFERSFSAVPQLPGSLSVTIDTTIVNVKLLDRISGCTEGDFAD